MRHLARALVAVVALGASFGAGWLLNEVRYLQQYSRWREERTEYLEAVNASAAMSEKSLTYALHYQDTLNECLTRLGLVGLAPERAAWISPSRKNTVTSP